MNTVEGIGGVKARASLNQLLLQNTLLRDRKMVSQEIPNLRGFNQVTGEQSHGNSVLVTGATGFIGGHVTKALCDAGYAVTALVRQSSRTNLSESSIRYVVGDLTDSASVRQAVQGVDAVVHVAGFISTASRDRQRLHDVNVIGARNLLAAVSSANIRRVVFTSTTSAVGALITNRPSEALSEEAGFNLRSVQAPYIQVKRAAHEAALKARQEGLPLVVLSPTLVLGPGVNRLTSMELIDTFVRRRLPGYLEGGLNAVDVRDLAQAYVTVLSHPDPAPHYILAGAENLTMQQLFQRLESVSGIRAPRRRIRRRTALVLGALVQRVAPQSSFSPASVRLGTLYWYFNAAAARRDLNFCPRPLNETLQDAVEWVRTEKH